MFRRWIDWADRLLIPFVFLIAIAFAWRMHKGWEARGVLWSDGEGYYMYLPATFIYGSWQAFDGKDGLPQIVCCSINSNGEVVTRYTYGVALLQAPFFLGAHAVAGWQNRAGKAPPSDWNTQTDEQWSKEVNQRKYSEVRGHQTGFSNPYAFAILIGAAFYMSLGLWLLKRALRRSFRKDVVLVTTELVGLATNLFYYTAGEGSMSHVYSFCLFAALVYYLPEWLRERSWVKSLLIGFCFGLILLIRPTNLMLVLLFPLWDVYSLVDLKARLRLLWSRRLELCLLVLMAIVVLIPQFIYWKHALGQWVVWSYGQEGFSNWAHPEILKVLFSYQNGLFMYTPVMLAAMVGVAVALRRREVSAPLLLLLFVLATYTFASWWAWWFGGAFGHRCYVEFYALLAYGLAVVVRSVSISKAQLLKYGMLVLALVLIYANLKMTMMYAPPWDGPTWTWERYLGIWANVARINWWPGF